MRSTFKVLFYVRKDKQKADGKVPVNCRITINGISTQFSVKKDINLSEWSAFSGRATGKSQEVKTLNQYLDNLNYQIKKIYHEQLEKGEDISGKSIKSILLGTVDEKDNSDEYTLVSLFEKFNQDFKQLVGKSKSESSYQKYKKTKEVLEDFLKQKLNKSDVELSDVNHLFIKDFEAFMKLKYHYSHNSASKSLQRFKTIILLAFNSGLILRNPFANYRITFEKVDRGFLTNEEIDVIVNKQFYTKRLEQVRDIFIFSCFTGLSYIDVKNLRKEHIVKLDGQLWIMTKRQKTNTESNVILLDTPKMILDKYKNTQLNGELLPVITNQKMNAYLKEIADVCGINKNLTFHVARHRKSFNQMYFSVLQS